LDLISFLRVLWELEIFEVLSLAELLHFQEVNLLKAADSFFKS
jgi:hypothetical protein